MRVYVSGAGLHAQRGYYGPVWASTDVTSMPYNDLELVSWKSKSKYFRGGGCCFGCLNATVGEPTHPQLRYTRLTAPVTRANEWTTTSSSSRSRFFFHTLIPITPFLGNLSVSV